MQQLQYIVMAYSENKKVVIMAKAIYNDYITFSGGLNRRRIKIVVEDRQLDSIHDFFKYVELGLKIQIRKERKEREKERVEEDKEYFKSILHYGEV